MLKSFVTVSAGLIGGAHAFWRMECPGRVGVARIDPIVNPGEISMHAHSIHGSSGKPETCDPFFQLASGGVRLFWLLVLGSITLDVL